MSMCCVSVARLPGAGDMLSRTDAGAAGEIVPTGCATMISPECPGADSLAIGMQHVQQESDVDFVFLVGLLNISGNAGVSQMITSGSKTRSKRCRSHEHKSENERNDDIETG